jgi:hypothetical protein
VALLLGSLLAGLVGLAPAGRVRADASRLPVAVWTGTEVLVNDYRFNPRTKAGRLMARPGAVTDGQAVVWTGSQLLEWGRCCAADQTLLPEGAAYDPSTDRWSPLETAGAPRLGRVLAADWSGTELLIWGEDPGGGAPRPTASTSAGDTPGAVGAAYDPARRTWRPLAAGGPPPDAGSTFYPHRPRLDQRPVAAVGPRRANPRPPRLALRGGDRPLDARCPATCRWAEERRLDGRPLAAVGSDGA